MNLPYGVMFRFKIENNDSEGDRVTTRIADVLTIKDKNGDCIQNFVNGQELKIEGYEYKVKEIRIVGISDTLSDHKYFHYPNDFENNEKIERDFIFIIEIHLLRVN